MPILSKRLAALEAALTTAPARLSPDEIEAAARRYGASLDEPSQPDLRAVAYWATATVQQLASDYAEMCRGAPASWE